MAKQQSISTDKCVHQTDLPSLWKYKTHNHPKISLKILKIVNTHLWLALAMRHLDSYLKETTVFSHKVICTSRRAGLSVVTSFWKQPGHSPTAKWKAYHRVPVEYDPAFKGTSTAIHSTVDEFQHKGHCKRIWAGWHRLFWSHRCDSQGTGMTVVHQRWQVIGM